MPSWWVASFTGALSLCPGPGDRRGCEALRRDPGGEPVDPHRLHQTLGLRGLAQQGLHLAAERVAVQTEVDDQLLGRTDARPALVVHAEVLGQRLVDPEGTLGGDGMQHLRCGRGPAYRQVDPVAHGPVVGVTGEPVGAEGEHGLRLHLVQHARDLVRRHLRVDLRALAVLVAEPVVLVHPEHRQRLLELAGAHPPESCPRVRVRSRSAGLPSGGRHADDPYAEVAEGCRHSPGQVGLVVGVRPHRHRRTERRQVGAPLQARHRRS